MINYPALAYELTTDPENIGYQQYITTGNHVILAGLLNTGRYEGDTVISIDKLEDYLLTTGKILLIESVSKTDNPAQNAALLILRLLSSRLQTFKFEEQAVQDVLNTLIENDVITEQDKTDISLLAPLKYVSRAESLFGNNTMVSHEDIGKALRGE